MKEVFMHAEIIIIHTLVSVLVYIKLADTTFLPTASCLFDIPRLAALIKNLISKANSSRRKEEKKKRKTIALSHRESPPRRDLSRYSFVIFSIPKEA